MSNSKIKYLALILLPLQIVHINGMEIKPKRKRSNSEIRANFLVPLRGLQPIPEESPDQTNNETGNELGMIKAISCPLGNAKPIDDPLLITLPTKPELMEQTSFLALLSEETIKNIDIQKLVELFRSGIDIKERSKTGFYTLLMLACKTGREDIVNLVLEQPQIDQQYINAYCSGRTTTALINSVTINSNSMVRKLLKHGANPHQPSFKGLVSEKTPLQHAICACQEILKNNKKNEALKKNYFEEFNNIITALIDAGPHPAYQDPVGMRMSVLIQLNKIRKEFGQKPLFIDDNQKKDSSCTVS